MRLDFETLAHEFGKGRYIHYYRNDSRFSTVQIYKENSKIDPDVLYITDVNPRLFRNAMPHNIMLVTEKLSESYFDEFKKDYPSTNIFMYETDDSAFTVLENMIACFHRHNTWSESLHTAMLKEQNISSLCDISENILRNSVVIVDSNLNLLGYTSHHDAHSRKLWEAVFPYAAESLNNGGVPTGLKASYTSDIRLHTVKTAMGLTVSFVCANIITDGYVTGKAVMFDDMRPLNGYYITMLNYFRGFIKMEFERSSSYSLYPRSRYGIFLAGILNDQEVPDKNDIAEQLNALDWHLRKYLRVSVITSVKEKLGLKHQLDIEENLNKIFNDTRTLLYDNKVVILTESDSAAPFSVNTSSQIVSYLKKNDLCIGISTAFEDIRQLRKYYDEAVTAVNTGSDPEYKDIVLFHYTDDNMRYLTDTLAAADDITAFCYPPLLALITADNEARTAYTDTLFCFIMNGKSPSEAAKALFIHRNTLNYRLDKISEMMGVNINDPDVLFNIELSFKLLDYRPMNLNEKELKRKEDH